MDIISTMLSAFIDAQQVKVVYNREACRYDSSLVVEIISDNTLGICRDKFNKFMRFKKLPPN